MIKFVPLKKQSKKAQRAFYMKKRQGWGGLSPITRQGRNPHAYQRSRQRRQERKAILQSVAEGMG